VKIKLSAAVGSGPTALAAFDAALRNAGVENYNLLPLSSVIPRGATIERVRHESPESEYGYRLYVVMAREIATRAGEDAWAGLGWTQEPGSRRGLFVELHGSTRHEVECAIDSTLDSMKQSRPYEYGKNEREIIGATCEDRPVCALVIATYTSEGWGR
jgi:arginine decarboxylase